MTCPMCGSINLDYQEERIKCHACGSWWPRPAPTLQGIIEAALHLCDGRCCDNAEDRAEIAAVVARAIERERA